MFDDFFASLSDINVYSITFRVILALIIGGILGLERGIKNRPAGFRTYMLVCMGATLVMCTNQYIYQIYGTSDPARLGAQVVSGIGFLGAGTIITTKRNQVKGLTTAAGLWAAACIGLAIGIGFYQGAIIGGIGILTVMTIMHKIDSYILMNGRMVNLYIEFDSPKSLSQFISFAQISKFEITDLQLSKDKMHDNSHTSAVLCLKSKERKKHSEIIQTLSCLEGITYIEEI